MEKKIISDEVDEESFCECGNIRKFPYPTCYDCLMEKRKTQTKCKCGKYFTSKSTNGKTYKHCYSCFAKKMNEKLT